MRFLIVDDNEDIVFLYTEVLEELGHEVVAIAFDGEEAIVTYTKLSNEGWNQPDMVLLDQRMPGMDGLEVLKKLLAINPSCKVIVMSADYKVKEKVIKEGAILFVEKPVNIAQLAIAINNQAVV